MLIATYLVFAEERQVEDDLEGFRVGGEDHQVGEATVQRLGRLVGAFLQLYHLTKKGSDLVCVEKHESKQVRAFSFPLSHQ